MKILKRNERDFTVCTDCSYFVFTELIDERYPDIKRGKCSLHHKIVDNRWADNCPDNNCDVNCYECEYLGHDGDFECDEDGDEDCDEYKYHEYEYCKIHGHIIDDYNCYDKCEEFKPAYISNNRKKFDYE